MKYSVTPKSIFRYLLLAIGFLLGANILAAIAKLTVKDRILKGIGMLFDFDREANIPSFYSTLTLFICAGLLFYIFKKSSESDLSKRLPWLVLSVLFCFLAFDEIASIHERLIPVMQNRYDFSGYLYYGWIVPYGIFVIVLGLLFIPFLKRLPSQVLGRFLLAGGLFISGAIGMESIGAKHAETYGIFTPTYSFFYTLEESLEMTGVAVFIYGLLSYIVNHLNFKTVKIKVTRSQN